MRYYIGPILVIVAALFVSMGASSVTHNKYTAAGERLAGDNQSLADSDAMLGMRQKQYNEAQRDSQTVNQFLAEWSPLATDGDDPGQIGVVMSETARAIGLVGNRRPTPKRKDYPFGNAMTTVQMVAYSVVGDFRLALEWLGKVEDRYPYGRVESVVISSTAGINEVEMLVNMSFPLEKEK